MRALVLSSLAFIVVAGCNRGDDAVRDFSAMDVRLPDGKSVRCELMITPTDMTKGMMFRDSLAPDRGMLFLHGKPGRNPYWMWQVKIPLDIIWMDSGRRIVEISANTPPCPTQTGKNCPKYGGNAEAMYVLELAGGMAAKYGLGVGQQLQF
jgi:uncharacterized membrane protein (UPF0127 family)